ncbi:MAG: AI-2E family transporter, partial [Methylobacteriaceae bacterium]|nr:AI-2E family transporter [Methylobacteriaceae bacterium]
MSVKRQILFWLGALVVFLGLAYLLGSALTPFAAAMFLSYLLDPLVSKLKSFGLNRLWASLLIMAVFCIVLILFAMIFVPLVAHQMGGFLMALPEYVVRLQSLVHDSLRPLLAEWNIDVPQPDMATSINDIVSQGSAWFGTFIKSLWSSGQALISLVSLFIVTPIVAFYLLIDWEDMIVALDDWLPRRHLDTIRVLCRDINRAVAGCIRGQTAVCLILGAYYSVGLTVVGLNFGALIGMMAGILSFIPYVGSIVGLFLALAVALSQFWPDWTMVMATAMVFFTGQFFEGYFLSPKIVGKSAGLHPVWLMFALLAFGHVLGFLGLLIA